MLIWRPIAIAAAIAMAVQSVFVAYENFFEENYFEHRYIMSEIAKLLHGLRVEGDTVELPELKNAAYYFTEDAGNYAFRVIDRAQGVVAEQNAGLFDGISPYQQLAFDRLPHFWMYHLGGKGHDQFAGGSRLTRAGREFWVEVAVLNDVAGVSRQIILNEFFSDVALTLVPITLLSMLFVAISIHRSTIRPIIRAARQAEMASAADPRLRIDLEGLPREAASLAGAVNRLLDRVGEYVRAQREFLARAAHELRTPLATLMLESRKVPEPRASRIQADVNEMSSIVSRLLDLARLETLTSVPAERVDLVRIVGHVVTQTRPAAVLKSTKILVRAHGVEPFLGDPVSVREAVRNLVDNAVKHTPAGTTVIVTCGPGAAICVEDNGPGIPEGEVEGLFQPFARGRTSEDGTGLGLTIVKRTMDFHQGELEVGRSPAGGLRICLRFAPLPSSAEGDARDDASAATA